MYNKLSMHLYQFVLQFLYYLMLFSIHFQEMRIQISTDLNYYWMDSSVRQHPTNMTILQSPFGGLEIILRIKQDNIISREIVISTNKAWDYLIPACMVPKISVSTLHKYLYAVLLHSCLKNDIIFWLIEY